MWWESKKEHGALPVRSRLTKVTGREFSSTSVHSAPTV